MKKRKMMAIVFLVVGIVCLGASHYIKTQVAGGQEQVDSAQKSLDRGSKLFSNNPVSKEVGDTLFVKPIQKKIDAGQEEVLYYARIAQFLQVAGIILIIVGAVLFFIPARSKS